MKETGPDSAKQKSQRRGEELQVLDLMAGGHRAPDIAHITKINPRRIQRLQKAIARSVGLGKKEDLTPDIVEGILQWEGYDRKKR